MKIMKLKRYYSGDDCTLGVLTSKDFYLYTLENPWKNNQRSISCIPAGTYNVRPFSGARYHDVWKVESVANRDAILIHYGNTEKDTEGCILVGTDVGTIADDKAVIRSRNAVRELTEHIGFGERFVLVIEDV